MALALWPSFELAITKLSAQPAQLKISNEFQFGDLVWIPLSSGSSEIRLNSTRMTAVESMNFVFGVAPTGPKQFFLTRFRPAAQRSTWLTGLKQHPQIEFELARVRVHPPTAGQQERLRLPQEVWKSVSEAETLKQREAERKTILDILMSDGGSVRPNCWRPPLRSMVTSSFGSPRVLPNGHHYFHTGEDLRAGVGNPLGAGSEAVVAFAGPMIVPGNNVILNHGGGLFSRYLHLDQIKVAKGERVKTSQRLGLTGSSGRVVAPHLHWEIVWKGIHANPSRFLAAWQHLCDPSSAE